MSSAPIPALPETPLWKRSLAGLMTAWCLLSPTGLVWAGPVADATGSAMAAAGTSATGTAVGAGLGNVMVSGALTSMATSATSQLLTTGKVDAGQMFRAGVTSGLTAGLTNGLGLDKFDGLSSTANGPVATGAGSVDWGVKAMGWAARAGVSAGVSSAINGGSFKTAFVNDFVANGAASIANTIGDLKQDGTISEVQRVAAHAVLGCAAQAASGGQCAGGAIGAMASSIAGNFVDDPKTLFDKALIVGGLSGLGGLAAIAAGKDGVSGFNAAKNEVQNNRLLHPDQIKRINELHRTDPEKAQNKLAVLCYLQNCNVDGLGGKLGGGTDEYKLYKAGADLLRDDSKTFNALVSEIKNDSVLLKGNFAYGGFSLTGQKYQAADLAGSTHYKDSVQVYKDVLVKPAGQLGIGVAKGVPNSVIDMANVGPTVVNGYKAIYDVAAGQKVQPLLQPLPYPDATTPTNNTQAVGNVVGSAITTIALGSGLSRIGAAGETAERITVGGALREPTLLDAETSALPTRAAVVPASSVTTATTSAANTGTATDAAAIRSRVLSNIADSQAGRASSNFGQFSKTEGQLQETLGIWPPNSGGYSPVPNVTLDVGMQLDRYGYPGGSYVSPLGASFGERALPSSYETTKPYFQYEVTQPLSGVTQAKVLPWFGQPGMGTQFQLPNSVQWYLENGYLKVIPK